MAALTELGRVELVPVVELEPWAFAAPERARPDGTGREVPGEWTRYWLDSLADAGVVGLALLRPGSWLVPVRAFTDPTVLGRYLGVVLRGCGGPDALADPDSRSALDGGLALCSGGVVLAVPGCCGDLADLAEWRAVVSYRRPEWKMVWVGHPCVSVRFEAGRLVLSGHHESDAPTARWAVAPEELGRAVVAAEAELEGFARNARTILGDLGVADAGAVARTMAGLAG